jgi:IMP dehydrogenase
MASKTLIDKFMARFPDEGITFDDVTLNTRPSRILPQETNLETRLTRNIRGMPFWSAAMDTVTESEMCIAMALKGGIGVLHKNLSVEEQVRELDIVKHYLNGLITSPISVLDNATIADVKAKEAEYQGRFSTFVVLDSAGKFVGLTAKRERDFAENPKEKVTEYMIPDLVIAHAGLTVRKAYDLMREHKVSKLVLVDNKKKVRGMYCWEDIASIVRGTHGEYNRDRTGKLRCAAAIGAKDYERAEALLEKGVDVLVVDSAHGGHVGVVNTIRGLRKLKARYDFDIVGGNVASGECAADLINAGADAVKVGVGPGSICTTRVVCGVGIPQISAVYDAFQVARKKDVPIIADGGIRHSGDVPKAIAAGAESVMLGGVLAGTDESPGEKILQDGRKYVVYRGMGSLGALKAKGGEGSKARYMQSNTEDAKLVPQGIEGVVPYAGSVSSVLHQYIGGLQQTMGYIGAKTIPEIRTRAKFIRVSSAGVAEAHPHDIKITKESPNYKGR